MPSSMDISHSFQQLCEPSQTRWKTKFSVLPYLFRQEVQAIQPQGFSPRAGVNSPQQHPACCIWSTSAELIRHVAAPQQWEVLTLFFSNCLLKQCLQAVTPMTLEMKQSRSNKSALLVAFEWPEFMSGMRQHHIKADLDPLPHLLVCSVLVLFRAQQNSVPDVWSWSAVLLCSEQQQHCAQVIQCQK